MMNCIVLDDDDDCVMVEPTSKPQEPNKGANFQKKLILQVRKHRMLYDNKHKMFSNVAKKELIWQRIAKKLNIEVDVCKSTWIELRYSYQCHARRLLKYFQNGQNKKEKRSSMNLETELMFLWRLIGNRKTCAMPFEIEDPAVAEKEVNEKIDNIQFGTEDLTNQVIDDDLILVEEPVECIVIDEDDDNGKTEKQFKVTSGMKTLIEKVKKYPELYDTQNMAFTDYTRKSFIWNAIASSLGDKATKLMKCWIIMQTRYEWELNQVSVTNKDNPTPLTNLQRLLEFLKYYILNNPDTVYKQSYYLKTAWHDPIDYFKDIYNLISRMKKSSDIVYITDALLRTPEKSTQYQSMWSEISAFKGNTAGQCETTWLIMRYFYWELMYMRQQSYQLTDKWYFETVITELYETSKTSQLAKQNAHQQQEQEQNKKDKQKTKEKSGRSLSRQLHLNAATRTKAPAFVPPQKTPTIINNMSGPTMVSQQSPLPKITGAVSLAPHAFIGGSLQIRPVAMAAANVPKQPQPQPQPQTQPKPQPQPQPQLLNGSTPNRQIPLNVLQQNNVATAKVPTVATIRSIAPPRNIQVAPPKTTMMRPTSTMIRNLGPSTGVRCLAPAVQMPTGVQIPTGIRAAKLISNVNTNNNITPPPTTTSSSALSTQLPLTTAVNVTAAAKATPPSTASTVATQMKITPLVVNTKNSGSVVAAAAAAPAAPAVATAVATATATITGETTPAGNSQLMPKISGALSLLNHNEILIELISSQNGNNLVVHGPPLSERYQLSMPTVAKFIREILAIPLLHNKCHNQPTLINSYWDHISKKFNLPPHICRACWNFLAQNFTHFPQIAPLKELMAPFRTTLSVWKQSDSLFKIFDDHCVNMGWLKHMARLPEVVECISTYPVLYKDVGKEALGESQSDMEALCAWRTLRLRFPKIDDIQDIWTAMKNCFCQYMSDLEYGIDNKWPINWWRALARLKFLVETKYATNEPFFYIISNKMMEEIERCAMLEMKARYNKPEPAAPKECEKLEDFELQIPMDLHHVPITSSSTSTSALLELSKSVESKNIETVALLTAVQKYPVIFGKADSIVKFEAWQQVAKELNMNVSECLVAFKQATQNYCAYKKRDSVSRCRLNEKYYKRLDDIFRGHPSFQKPGRCKLNIKTPFQLNHSVETDEQSSSELVFPERFIAEINMSNSPSDLVVKNWNYALGNLQLDDLFHAKLRNIISKYKK